MRHSERERNSERKFSLDLIFSLEQQAPPDPPLDTPLMTKKWTTLSRKSNAIAQKIYDKKLVGASRGG